MEFKIENIKQLETLPKAKGNFKELKQFITEQLEQYKGLVYDDTRIKDAKADRAKLNALIKQIDDAKKLTKSFYLQPFTEFENEIKELIKLIDKPCTEIDNQVKSYEARKKAEKEARLLDIAKISLASLNDLVRADKLINDKMLNSSYNEKNAISEIEEKIAKIKTDLETIKGLKHEQELTLVDVYLCTFDLGSALNEARRLDEVREAAKAAAVIVEPVEVKPIEQVGEVFESTKLYTRQFEVTGTKEQLIALGDYMKANGIEYKGIKNAR